MMSRHAAVHLHMSHVVCMFALFGRSLIWQQCVKLTSPVQRCESLRAIVARSQAEFGTSSHRSAPHTAARVLPCDLFFRLVRG